MSGKYVPPSRRGMSDAQARVQAGDSMPDRRQREDTAAIRVSNLSENVQEADLQVSFNSNNHNLDSFFYIKRSIDMIKEQIFISNTDYRS